MTPAENHDLETGPGGQPEEIDVSLLEDSLRLTPWQRLLENERALALVRMLEAARTGDDGTADPDSRAA